MLDSERVGVSHCTFNRQTLYPCVIADSGWLGVCHQFFCRASVWFMGHMEMWEAGYIYVIRTHDASVYYYTSLK